MREYQYFLEIGIKSYAEQDDDVSMDKTVREQFPKNPIMFCDAIQENYMPGWTVGVVDDYEGQMMAISKEFPGTVFVAKLYGNFGITYEYYLNGMDPICKCIPVHEPDFDKAEWRYSA